MAGVSHIPRPLCLFYYYNYYFYMNQFVPGRSEVGSKKVGKRLK
jgi:hypothetical protein